MPTGVADRAVRRRYRPSGGLLRFVLRRLVALRAALARHHARRVRAHRARPEQRGRDEPRRAGRRRPGRGHGVRAALRARQAAPAPLPDLPRAPRARRPRPVVADPRRGHARPRPVHPGDGRARALLDPDRGDRRHHVRRDRRRCGATGRPTTRCASTSLAGISMPTFWIALVALYVGFYRLGWFPGGGAARPGHDPAAERHRPLHDRRAARTATGPVRQALHHLLLPALVLAAFNVSLLTRFTRSAVLEVIGNDYVRAARAKGMPERIVVVRYILRAALPSVVTVLGLVFANVLTGAVLVEKIFSWPGIGQYAYQAAVNLDVPAIAGVSLFVAVVYVDGQLRRRHPLRRHRPADPGHMSAASRVRPRAPSGRRCIRPACGSRSRSVGLVIAVAWIVIAIFAPLIAPADPLAQTFTPSQAPSWHAPVRHRRARPRRPQPRHLRRARDAPDRARCSSRSPRRSAATIGAIAGYFRGVARRRC